MKGNKRKGRRPGTWELRVDAGRDPLTRGRRQKSVVFEGTSREADVALAELITKSSRGQVPVCQRTVGDAIEAGLRQRARGVGADDAARIPDVGGVITAATANGFRILNPFDEGDR